MDEFATGKANVYNEEKKLTSEIVPSVFAKETFNEFSSFPGTVCLLFFFIKYYS